MVFSLQDPGTYTIIAVFKTSYTTALRKRALLNKYQCKEQILKQRKTATCLRIYDKTDEREISFKIRESSCSCALFQPPVCVLNR